MLSHGIGIPFNERKLREATADTPEPMPGYLLQECVAMTFLSLMDINRLCDSLRKLLSHRSPHVRYKALQIIREASLYGHQNFRIEFKVQSEGLRDCAGYEGPLDTLHGDYYNQRVRAIAGECIDIVINGRVAEVAKCRKSRIVGYANSGNSASSASLYARQDEESSLLSRSITATWSAVTYSLSSVANWGYSWAAGAEEDTELIASRLAKLASSAAAASDYKPPHDLRSSPSPASAAGGVPKHKKPARSSARRRPSRSSRTLSAPASSATAEFYKVPSKAALSLLNATSDGAETFGGAVDLLFFDVPWQFRLSVLQTIRTVLQSPRADDTMVEFWRSKEELIEKQKESSQQSVQTEAQRILDLLHPAPASDASVVQPRPPTAVAAFTDWTSSVDCDGASTGASTPTRRGRRKPKNRD